LREENAEQNSETSGFIEKKPRKRRAAALDEDVLPVEDATAAPPCPPRLVDNDFKQQDVNYATAPLCCPHGLAYEEGSVVGKTSLKNEIALRTLPRESRSKGVQAIRGFRRFKRRERS